MRKNAFSLQKTLKGIFSIDLRALGIFRIGLASIILLDLFNRARFLEAHYADSGVLPRAPLIEQVVGYFHFSFHLFNGAWELQALLFLINAFFAIALLFGYRTKFVSIVCWILLISLQARNPLLTHGGDNLLRMLTFWGMFLPLGAKFSIDANNQKISTTSISSIPTVALLLQAFFLYFFSGISKNFESYFLNGDAVFLALNKDFLTTSFGRFLLEYPSILKALSRGTWILEVFGSFLLFFPVYNSHFRSIAMLLFVSFQIGLMLTMHIGFFPIISILAIIPFLPTSVIDKFSQTFESSRIVKLGTNLKTTLSNKLPPLQYPIRIKPSKFVSLFTLLFIVIMVINNLQAAKVIKLSKSAKNFISITQTQQRWKMFSPSPTTLDGWYVIPGKLADGSEVDLMRKGSEVSWDKPENVFSLYGNYRWRVYLETLRAKRKKKLRPYYAAYLCRGWNRSADSTRKVESLEIYFMLERTKIEEPITVKKKLKWSGKCFEGI